MAIITCMRVVGACIFLRTKRGFTLIEILVGMAMVTMAILLVGGLGQQVMQLAKRGTQTGTILELRSMTNSIIKNSDSWLDKMRSSVHTNGLYAGCIPDPKVNVSTFNCPTSDASLFAAEPDLAAIANGQFHVVSAPILSNTGELIAGSVSSPVFLSSEGRPCADSQAERCAFKSTGYFLRSNVNTSQDPGSIKFVIKIERNSLNVASASTPMKAQFMSVDIGESWKDLSANFSGNCPVGSVKVGYLSNGKPSCVSTSAVCANSQVPIGVDAGGNPICKTLPDCSSSGGSIVLNSVGDDLICASASPCGANKLFLGYFAGSGEPMCSSSEVKCPAGHVQTGISISAGVMQAECEVLPSCTEANKRLAFNGTNFVCEAATASITCTGNQVMTGINSDGQPICVDRAPASTSRSCPSGQYVVGILADNSLDCKPLSNLGSGSSAGEVLLSWTGSNLSSAWKGEAIEIANLDKGLVNVLEKCKSTASEPAECVIDYKAHAPSAAVKNRATRMVMSTRKEADNKWRIFLQWGYYNVNMTLEDGVASYEWGHAGAIYYCNSGGSWWTGLWILPCDQQFSANNTMLDEGKDRGFWFNLWMEPNLKDVTLSIYKIR